MSLDVRRGADRFRTEAGGRETWHSFSFGAHYDPANTGFGLLTAHNDERLPPGTGYAAHEHREAEIVSVVLAGSLRHDSSVGEAVLGPGDVQRLTAGTGVSHSETSAAVSATTRFVQVWLRPAADGLAPSYAHVPQALGPVEGRLHVVDLGPGTPGALHLGTVAPGGAVELPAASRSHLFVAEGACTLDSQRLGSGDAARLGDAGPFVVTAERQTTLLAWVMPGRR